MPERGGIRALRGAAPDCRGCELSRDATQVVFSTGSARIYLTNAVKHFRFELRGKRRIHAKPSVAHIEACRPWLAAELGLVRPDVIVCLGATAARAVLGRPVAIGATRGRPLDDRLDGARVFVTTHPSALLRIRDAAERESAAAQLASDLRLAASHLTG